MAILKHPTQPEVLALPARLLVGRGPACGLRLDDRHVSGEHATLAWTGEGWTIRDLGSRNGTFVDGRRLVAGEVAGLKAGCRIGFGQSDLCWVLADAGQPSALAEDLSGGGVRAASNGILALPDDARPEIVVFADTRGAWLAEHADGEAAPVQDHAVLQAGGRSWRLRLPETQEGTLGVVGGPTLDTIRLRFDVSRDEEHVQLTVLFRGKQTALEPREHGYLLLTLARARLDDAHLPTSERGWLDREDLCRMLRTDANALNVAIYRARQQLVSAGVEGAAGIVEVRRGRRRLGIDEVEVLRA